MSSCASSLDDGLLFEDKINGITVYTKSLRARDGSLVAQFAAGSGLSISGNLLTWSISSLVTSGYEPGSYLFDLEISISGQKRTYVSGAFRVVKDITR